MAVVKYSSIITEIKGKVGGNVFQKCGQSLSMRVNQSQITSNSPKSLKTRNNLRDLASTWARMTLAQKTTWLTNAASYPTFDRFGNRIVLNPYQLFMRQNRVTQLVSTTPVLSASAYANIANNVSALDAYYRGTQTFNITIDPTLPANQYVFYYISDALPPNSYQIPTNIRFCGYTNPSAQGVYNIYSKVTPAFKIVPAVGECFYFLARSVNVVTGQWADELDDIITVLA